VVTPAAGTALAVLLYAGEWFRATHRRDLRASVIAPEHFPDDTVWSRYGSGYGFMPVLLPVLAAWWLSAARVRTTAR
jgi:hypothetical protein